MGTNGVNGNASDMVQYYDKYIAEKNEQKAKDYEACDAAEQARDAAYVDYKSIYSQKEEKDFAKKQLQKQIDNLRFQMKIAMANASKNGKSNAEISGIKQSYMDQISKLNSTFTTTMTENSTFADLVEKKQKAYTNTLFGVNSAEAGLLGTLRSLTDAYLDRGKYKQQEIVNDAIANNGIDFLG